MRIEEDQDEQRWNELSPEKNPQVQAVLLPRAKSPEAVDQIRKQLILEEQKSQSISGGGTPKHFDLGTKF